MENFAVESGSFKVPSLSIFDQDLFVDWVLLAPKEQANKKVVYINCGTHGIESHVACGFLLEHFERVVRQGAETAYLFVHALNPYGFKYSRRVTENNVDLNRNFVLKREEFKDPNTAYPLVEVFLNRPSPARDDFFYNLDHLFYSLYYVSKLGKPAFRQAVVQGQYTYPTGLFYGGKELEPQAKWLLDFIPQKLASFDEVLAIDYHTGYGARGELHLFGSTLLREDLKNDLSRMFIEKSIDWGDSKNFYQTFGDFTDFLVAIMPEKRVLPMTFEFGTLDTQTLSGSLKSLRIMRLENQSYHWKALGEEALIDIKSKFKEMFFPSEKDWEELVREQNQKILLPALERFSRSEKM
ncbi:MAG: M14 family metallopeptidase [Bdellovibrio sp.]